MCGFSFFFSFIKVQVLRSLMAVQAAFKERRHKEQTEVKLQQVQAKYGLRSDDSLSDEEEEGCQLPDSDAVAVSDHEADLSISDLTDSGEWWLVCRWLGFECYGVCLLM